MFRVEMDVLSNGFGMTLRQPGHRKSRSRVSKTSAPVFFACVPAAYIVFISRSASDSPG